MSVCLPPPPPPLSRFDGGSSGYTPKLFPRRPAVIAPWSRLACSCCFTSRRFVRVVAHAFRQAAAASPAVLAEALFRAQPGDARSDAMHEEASLEGDVSMRRKMKGKRKKSVGTRRRRSRCRYGRLSAHSEARDAPVRPQTCLLRKGQSSCSSFIGAAFLSLLMLRERSGGG